MNNLRSLFDALLSYIENADEKRFLVCVFLLSFIFRLAGFSIYIGLTVPPSDEPEPDAVQYEEIARNLVEKGEFFQTMNGQKYYSYRSPLWPLMVAATYRVFGYSHLAVRLLGITLSSLVPVFIYFSCRKIFGLKTAILSTLISIIYPFFIFYSGLYLTDNLFLVLLTATMLPVLSLEKNSGMRFYALTGFMLGLTSLARPVVYLFPFLILIWLVYRFGFEKKVLFNAVILGLTMLMVVSPWFIRNYIIHGRLVTGDTHGGNSFWGGNNPALINHPEFIGSWYIPRDDELTPEYIIDPRKISESEQDLAYFRAGKLYLSRHPEVLPYFIWRRFIRFFNPVPSGSLFRKLVSILSYGLLLPFMITGAILGLRNLEKTMPVYLLLFQILAVSLLIVSNTRMRLPVEPYLIMFASFAILWLTGPRDKISS